MWKLTPSFPSRDRSEDCGSEPAGDLWDDRYADGVLTPSPDAKIKGSRPVETIASRLNESRSALNCRAPFGYPD